MNKFMSVLFSIVFLMIFSIVNVYGCDGFADCERLAKQGDASAQFTLGHKYRNGDGVVQNYKDAVRWLRKAAEQGYAPAQLYLGAMYDNGGGVVPDGKEAVKWYRKAAEQGIAKAQLYLGAMYLEGELIVQDFVKAHMYFNIASANGDTGAKKLRDLIAGDMASEQIEKAQQLAGEWMERY